MNVCVPESGCLCLLLLCFQLNVDECMYGGVRLLVVALFYTVQNS